MLFEKRGAYGESLDGGLTLELEIGGRNKKDDAVADGLPPRFVRVFDNRQHVTLNKGKLLIRRASVRVQRLGLDDCKLTVDVTDY